MWSQIWWKVNGRLLKLRIYIGCINPVIVFITFQKSPRPWLVLSAFAGNSREIPLTGAANHPKWFVAEGFCECLPSVCECLSTFFSTADTRRYIMGYSVCQVARFERPPPKRALYVRFSLFPVVKKIWIWNPLTQLPSWCTNYEISRFSRIHENHRKSLTGSL